MIHAIANQYNITIPESNILDLGYMNGWGESTYKFVEELQPFRITGEGSSRSVGGYVTEYVSKYKDSITDHIITITYRIDSGD